MRALLLTVALVVMLPGIGDADNILINNGSAPPDPNNVIDDSRYASDYVVVRNVGCPPGWPAAYLHDPCPSPGPPTEVELTDWCSRYNFLYVLDTSLVRVTGGEYLSEGQFYVRDTATLIVTGGELHDALVVRDSGVATITGGALGYGLLAYHSGNIMLIGGSVSSWARLQAYDSSTITIAGWGFEVDGAFVSYGDLVATWGTLTGTLFSGDSIDVDFDRETTATITLVPGDDGDGDLIHDAVDNCPTIANGPSEDNQADQDGDAVGDACDNCVEDYNPRATYPGYRTTTGGQLDDDADGYGNYCDAVFKNDHIHPNVTDTDQYRTAVNKPVNGTDCGSPAGSLSCDRFDVDGVHPVITALDTIRFKQLRSRRQSPKCPACPLECVGDACP